MYALNNYGNLLEAEGNHERSLMIFEQCVRSHPMYASGQFGLARAAAELGQRDRALAHYETALELNPNDVNTLNNLANVLMAFGDLARAETCLGRALALAPQFALALSNLGNLYRLLGRYAEAEQVLSTGRRLYPRNASILYNLAVVLQQMHRHADAAALYRAVLDIDPDNLLARIYCYNQFAQIADWDASEPIRLNLMQTVLASAVPGTPIFSLLPISTSPEDQQKLAKQVSGFINTSHPVSPRIAANDKQRLRVGYLSSDFYGHATAYLLTEVLENHRHDEFEWFAYSFGPVAEDEMKTRIAASVDHFREVGALSFSAAAELIRGDQIDILVDLKGYTENAKPEILAERAAPVQVSWLGYPGTMGAKFIDVILADRFVIPTDAQRYYSEQVVYLPHCYQPNASLKPPAVSESFRPNGWSEKDIILCCFNQTYKIHPEIFSIWLQILEQNSDCVLWLFARDTDAQSNLCRHAERAGISKSRLFFADPVTQKEHLARYHSADLALDTFPYASHTTASDALRAGCPLITCAGETFASRVAGSLLHQVGLTDCITYDLQSYEARIRELCVNRTGLRDLRERLWKYLPDSPLYDPVKFATDLEETYRQIWQDRSVKPRSN